MPQGHNFFEKGKFAVRVSLKVPQKVPIKFKVTNIVSKKVLSNEMVQKHCPTKCLKKIRQKCNKNAQKKYRHYKNVDKNHNNLF